MLARQLAAWSVHLFTATGAVWSLLALRAIAAGDWRAALWWMVLAMVVDCFDGMLARAVRVKEVLPGFDGELLDNMVDYLSYVVVPAFFLVKAGLLPAALAVPGAAAVLLSSAYQFSQADAKTTDHFFKGFPSFWNVAAFYLFFLQLSASWNVAIIAALALGVFVPVKWAYPSRMPRLRGLTLGLTVLWGLSIGAILWRYPDPGRWLLAGSLAYLAYYAAVSLYLSVLSPSPAVARADTDAR